jgi:hypothetical protein
VPSRFDFTLNFCAGDSKRINIRLKQKLEQTKPSDGILPAYVVVVEFSKPIVITAKK